MNLAETNILGTKVQRQIYQLVRLYQSCDRVCLVERGVSASQGYTLLSLPQEGSLNMNELSEAMGLANSTTTRIVDQLVKKELVHRREDIADRRVVRVQLTAQGRELWQTLDTELHDFFSQIMNGIQEDERPVILHALERLTTSLAKALGGCCPE